MHIYSLFYMFNEHLLRAPIGCIRFLFKSHHHGERSLLQWKEKLLFLSFSLSKHTQPPPNYVHYSNINTLCHSAATSVQLATKSTSVRLMLQQKGIRSQYPDTSERENWLTQTQYPRKPFILRIAVLLGLFDFI